MDVQGNTRLSPTIATWPCASYGVIRNLRFLLVFIVLSHLCISLVEASVDELPDNVRRTLTDNPRHQERQNIVRLYRLQTRCNTKLVRLRLGKHIRANGRGPGGRDSVLRVESFNLDSNVRIQSEHYKHYICFDKRGRLKRMENGEHAGCEFKEILTRDHYTEFQSVRSPDLYLGFRKNGKPKRGGKYAVKKPDQCSQFLKIPVGSRTRKYKIRDPQADKT